MPKQKRMPKSDKQRKLLLSKLQDLQSKGLTLSAAARAYNIPALTALRLQQSEELKASDPLGTLSPRLRNILRQQGFDTREKVEEAFDNGRLVPSYQPAKQKPSIRGYGWTSHLELARWLGKPKPKRPKRPKPIPREAVPLVCPHCQKPIELQA